MFEFFLIDFSQLPWLHYMQSIMALACKNALAQVQEKKVISSCTKKNAISFEENCISLSG